MIKILSCNLLGGSSDPTVPLVTALNEAPSRYPFDLFQVSQYDVLECCKRGFRITVSPAGRLGDDFINDAQFEE